MLGFTRGHVGVGKELVCSNYSVGSLMVIRQGGVYVFPISVNYKRYITSMCIRCEMIITNTVNF